MEEVKRSVGVSAVMSGAVREILVGTASRLAVSAHLLFYRRDERWVSDLAGGDVSNTALKGAVMIFAPSAGEVMSALPMLKLLSSRHPDLPMLICATTISGISAAQNAGFSAVRCFPSSRSLYRRLTAEIEPKGLIIVQVSYAPGLPIDLMAELKSKDLPVVVVNGALPDRDVRRAGLWLYRGRAWIYNAIRAFCMRSKEDADRVISLGADPSKVFITGDMKYDAALDGVDEEHSEALSKELWLIRGQPIVVAGSTHNGEERVILEAFRRLRVRVSDVRLIIAPRSLRRVEDVRSLAAGMGFSVGLRSSAPCSTDIIVLDSMGELSLLYGLASVAFVGGTLVPVGGHNVLEPAAWGKPVLFGPHIEHTADAAEMLLASGGAAVVKDADDLNDKLAELLRSPNLCRDMGVAALESVRSRTGALKACVDVVEQIILGDDRVAAEWSRG